MERITIHTGMERFVLAGKLTEVGETQIASVQHFSNALQYVGLEALAQLGALHIRYLIDFSRHVFLLKIKECQLPPNDILDGEYHLSGKFQSRSERACFYQLTAKGEDDDHSFGGIFLFGITEYDQRFERTVLQRHYQTIFSCLSNE